MSGVQHRGFDWLKIHGQEEAKLAQLARLRLGPAARSAATMTLKGHIFNQSILRLKKFVKKLIKEITLPRKVFLLYAVVDIGFMTKASCKVFLILTSPIDEFISKAYTCESTNWNTGCKGSRDKLRFDVLVCNTDKLCWRFE